MNYLKKISTFQALIGFMLLVLAAGSESLSLMIVLTFIAIVLLLPVLNRGDEDEDL